jgi:YidC/Oxa1 family membrane protein insertase
MSILDNDNNQVGDKRTLMAIVLSVVVISAGFMLQAVFFPPQPQQAPAAQSQTGASAAAPKQAASPAGAASAEASSAPAPSGEGFVAASRVVAAPLAEAPAAERSYTIETDLIKAVISNKGGDIVSLKLKKHKDHDDAVDLIVQGSEGAQGLSVSFGQTVGSSTQNDLMNAVMLDSRTIAFSKTYLATVPGKSEPVPFTLKKTYTFRDGDYMFGLAIGLENSANDYLPLDTNGIAYTLTMGPQIGPKLTSAPGSGGNTDFRKFIRVTAGKKKEESPKAGKPLTLKEQPTWVAIAGKYFTFIALPELADFKTTLTTSQDPILHQTNEISLSRPAIKASKQTDTYYFYFGPKTNNELKKYTYDTDNAFGKKGLDFELAMDGSSFFRWMWLENGMKFFLNIFFSLVPNFGIAIILVTILVKALLFPLTKNGSIASARMQELQPKMQELQAKYKDNPQKLNQEMAAFYKREGYNPMSGCLPLLIQFPIFLAMYNLFNNHFDLRGAMFIPGWIPDLSQPEAIFTFSNVNLLIWQIDAIRALPIIYLISQLLYGKYAQTTSPGQSGAQMKLMMYGMPIIFFFILYNTPSGLLVYWIVSNVLSIGQQVVINNVLRQRKLALAAAAPAPVIAPSKKGQPQKSAFQKPQKAKRK